VVNRSLEAWRSGRSEALFPGQSPEGEGGNQDLRRLRSGVREARGIGEARRGGEAEDGGGREAAFAGVGLAIAHEGDEGVEGGAEGGGNLIGGDDEVREGHGGGGGCGSHVGYFLVMPRGRNGESAE